MNKTTYYVACPALGESETTSDLDKAMDLCYSMHDESDSYAYIRDSLGEIVGEYGDIMEAVEQGVIWPVNKLSLILLHRVGGWPIIIT